MVLAQWTDATEWLAAAAQDPQICKRDWEHGSDSVHLLPTGRLWDVLIVPTCLGLRAADLLGEISDVKTGPILLDDRRQRAGLFLPVGSGLARAHCAVRYLSTGGWIAAPAPLCRWGNLRWLTPPDVAGVLNSPTAVQTALHQAAEDLVCAHYSARIDDDTSAPRRDCSQQTIVHSSAA